MSALEQLISQYREKKNIPKSRKRARDSDHTFVAERTTKGKTEQGSEDADHVVVNISASNQHHFMQNDV